MKKQTKKLIAPIMITILIVCYFILYISVTLYLNEMPKFASLLFIIIPILLAILSVYMLFERVKEIRGGEEDDLSKY